MISKLSHRAKIRISQASPGEGKGREKSERTICVNNLQEEKEFSGI